jgi:hypothetical protein
MTTEEAMTILGEAPTYLLFDSRFKLACQLAVEALQEKSLRERPVQWRWERSAPKSEGQG